MMREKSGSPADPRIRNVAVALVGAFFAAGAAIATLVGCGGPPPAYPVSGVVKFAGQPLIGGGSIQLLPLDDPEAIAAGGEIQRDGRYVLRTYAEADGAVAGRHRVMVRQDKVLQKAVYPPAAPSVDGREPPAVEPTTPEIRVGEKDLIPDLYSTPDSPLIITVEKGPQELSIELVRQPATSTPQ